MSFGLRVCPFLLVIGPLTALSACERTPGPEPEGNMAAAAPENEPTAVPQNAMPAPGSQLDRATLLEAVARAASAHTAGLDDREAQAGLAGRRFTMKLRFGCGPATGSGAGALSWQYDEGEQRLTLKAEPNIDATTPALAGLPEGAVEAVDGFWIPQPWLLTDACPAEPAGAASADAQPIAGIAHYFTTTESRVHQRARRSYEIVRRADPAILPPQGGFNLVLEGRLRPWPGEGVIRCDGSGATARPVCIASVEFDRVAFENPESGQTIAQWNAG